MFLTCVLYLLLYSQTNDTLKKIAAAATATCRGIVTVISLWPSVVLSDIAL